MSDEYVYRNENTGDVVRYPYRSERLEMLPNWTTLQEPAVEGDQEPDGDPPAPPEMPQDPGPVANAESTEPPVTEPVSPPATEPETVERPARSASKADWVAYAHTRAQDSDEEAAINGLTKEQLVEQYGGDS
ncbi:hypothetical protein ACWD3Z_05555 [Streptomyces sp. NPDC002740]